MNLQDHPDYDGGKWVVSDPFELLGAQFVNVNCGGIFVGLIRLIGKTFCADGTFKPKDTVWAAAIEAIQKNTRKLEREVEFNNRLIWDLQEKFKNET